MPSTLRSTPLAGSRYGSPAARLTCGSGTGPAPAVHRWTAVRLLPRRTAPGPPRRVPAPRPVPRPAPRRPRAAARRPPAVLRTARPTQVPPPPCGGRRRRPRRPGIAGPGPARPPARRGTRGTTRPPALPLLKRTPLRTHIRAGSALRSRRAVCAGARGERDLARVREAEAGIAGCAFGEHGGQDAGPLVEVVVDLG